MSQAEPQQPPTGNRPARLLIVAIAEGAIVAALVTYERAGISTDTTLTLAAS